LRVKVASLAAAGSVDTEIRAFQGAGGGAMQRRRFSREFEIEAVRLVRKRGSGVSDIDVHENVVRH
jgi:transposase-like protein